MKKSLDHKRMELLTTIEGHANELNSMSESYRQQIQDQKREYEKQIAALE